ncbi:MAG: caspase family protein [Anaerolineae bacterium]|nr:caspase family protein [Anaerolineae bacterium]
MSQQSYSPEYRHSWAIIIGIDQYQDPTIRPLDTAVKGSRAVAALLRDELGFESERIIILTNETATQRAIRRAFSDPLGNSEKVGRDDRVIIYFGGHGLTYDTAEGLIGCIAPYDIEGSYWDTAISMDELTRLANRSHAKHVLFLIDACFSGYATVREVGRGAQRQVSDYLTRSVRQVISAGTRDQAVSDLWGPGQHSLFTGFLLQALHGAMPAPGGILRAFHLAGYLQDQVGQHSYSRQTPQYAALMGSQGGDFVFSVRDVVELPDWLVSTVKSTDPTQRMVAVSHLLKIAQGDDPRLADVAVEQLEILADDENPLVNSSAQAALEQILPSPTVKPSEREEPLDHDTLTGLRPPVEISEASIKHEPEVPAIDEAPGYVEEITPEPEPAISRVEPDIQRPPATRPAPGVPAARPAHQEPRPAKQRRGIPVWAWVAAAFVGVATVIGAIVVVPPIIDFIFGGAATEEPVSVYEPHGTQEPAGIGAEISPIEGSTEEEPPQGEPAGGALTNDPAMPLYISNTDVGTPQQWSPFFSGDYITSGTVGLVYEPLFLYDPMKDEMIPFLAKTAEWSDANTYLLILREGITWTDGEPLTALDVAFTFDIAPTYDLWYSPVWNYLVDVEVLDDVTLQFTFNDPLYQDWAYHLYNIPIVPEHIWAGSDEDEIYGEFHTNPIGSGAYLYDSHTDDTNVWVRNLDWWGIDVFGPPAPTHIVNIAVANDSFLAMQLAGELDISNRFLPEASSLSAEGSILTYYHEPPYMVPGNTTVLFMNTTKAPLDDSRVRRALAYAIDSYQIVDYAYSDLVLTASPSGLPPHLYRYIDQDIESLYDPEVAIQLLAEAGYVDTDGDGYVNGMDKISISCPSGWTGWEAAINVIADNARKVGINVVVETLDYQLWRTELAYGTFDMTLNNQTGMSNTPWTLYDYIFKHPIQDEMWSGNYGRYDNEQLFYWVDELARIPYEDTASTQMGSSAIQEMTLTEMPVIPLWYTSVSAQYTETRWTNWPSEDGPNIVPSTWPGYWQTGGLMMLINLEPAR